MIAYEKRLDDDWGQALSEGSRFFEEKSAVQDSLRRITKRKRVPVARFAFGDVDADFDGGQIRKGGAPVTLAAKEMQLLRYLVDRRGVVVSREELLGNVWEYQSEVSSRTIDVHVAWLRQKLEDNPQSPRHIHTVRGVGYRFTE